MSLFYFMVMLRGKDKCYDLIPLSIVCLFQSNCHRNTRNQTIARAGVGLKSFQSSWVSSRLITSRPQWCASTWQHMVLLDLLWTARITENAFVSVTVLVVTVKPRIMCTGQARKGQKTQGNTGRLTLKVYSVCVCVHSVRACYKPIIVFLFIPNSLCLQFINNNPNLQVNFFIKGCIFCHTFMFMLIFRCQI